MGRHLDPAIALRQLRASRSDPPGAAASEMERRATYGASLQQFEELLAAARDVGPASKPLLLFYALSQAGRALVAAHGTGDFRVRGHGLQQGGPVPENLLAFPIRLAPRRDGTDAFGAVRRVLGAGACPESTQIGAVWAALPRSYAIPDTSWEDTWRPALSFDVRRRDERFGGRVLGAGSNPLVMFDDVLVDLRRSYPTLPAETYGVMLEVSRDLGPGSWMADIEWPSEAASLDEVLLEGGDDDRWLLPGLAAGQAPQPQLVLWWILLFGLSLVARYEPDAWAKSLHVERSGLAVPLEAMLDGAQEAVPQLVHEEMFRGRGQD